MYSLNLSGVLSYKSSLKRDCPNLEFDGIYKYSEKSYGKLMTRIKAFINYTEENNFKYQLITLNFPDDETAEKRFEHKNAYLKALRNYYRRRNQEFYYICTSEHTKRFNVHFHILISLQRINKWELVRHGIEYFKRRIGFGSIAHFSRSSKPETVWYIVKYLSKDFRGKSDHWMENHRLKMEMAYPFRLWNAKLPYYVKKDVKLSEVDTYENNYYIYAFNHYDLLTKKIRNG